MALHFLYPFLLDYFEMVKQLLFCLCLVLLQKTSWAIDDYGLNEAANVNQTIEEGFGSRASGMAITFGGFQTDANAIANSPAGINDISDFTFSTSHAEKFGSAKFDAFAFLLPFEANSTLGLGLSRYGVSGVESRQIYNQAPEVFSTADYNFIGTFARRWGAIDAGINFNLLYRQLDQDGIGMRGDGMVQYTSDNKWRVGALIKGLIPSSASWQSGFKEYEPSDLYLTASTLIPAPYFYGTLQIAAQTEGLFQKRAKSAFSLIGSRVYEDPINILATTSLGGEFLFDFGLACRIGFQEIGPSKNFASTATFGIGYSWKRIVGFDYSFTPHPDLLSTHRISLQFTPSFPKFKGLNYRPWTKESKAIIQTTDETTDEIKEEIPELNKDQAPEEQNPQKPEKEEILEEEEK